jgi:hypothetical protein
MRRYFVLTDWRANITILLIILFFTAPLFLVAYKLGVYVRDHYYLARITEQALQKEKERAEKKREVGQQWGSANCGENFERALHEDQFGQGADRVRAGGTGGIEPNSRRPAPRLP